MNRTMRLAVLLVAAGCGGGDGSDDGGTDVPVETEADGAPEDDGGVDVEPEAEAEGGGDVVADEGGIEDAPVDAEAEVPALGCDEVAEGWNRGFPAGALRRDFLLDLPADVETGGPWPVVFNFHGLGDTAENMRHLLSSAVDTPSYPFILVTPEDTNFSLLGLFVVDWEVATVTEENREALMFDAVLACLESRWGVDEDRVHVVGFSMGGFTTDALGTVRGEALASTITFSGAYGNNAANLAPLGMLGSAISWPPLDSAANPYPQVFLHGGTADTYSLTLLTLHFDQFAANDAAFLHGAGHPVFLCDHGDGHTVPAGFRAPQIVEFFRDHPRGTTVSPYADALPADWPAYCAAYAP